MDYSLDVLWFLDKCLLVVTWMFVMAFPGCREGTLFAVPTMIRFQLVGGLSTRASRPPTSGSPSVYLCYTGLNLSSALSAVSNQHLKDNLHFGGHSAPYSVVSLWSSCL